MRVRVEQVAAIVHLNLTHTPNRALSNQVARGEPCRVVRSLERNNQLDTIALACCLHGIRLAEVDRHRLLTEDGFRTTRGCGDDHLGVLLVP